VARVIKQVAGQLRNTPAVCRKSYIHPKVIEYYVGGYIQPLVPLTGARDVPERSLEEDALLDLLREGAAVIQGAEEVAMRPRRKSRRKARAPWSPKVLRGR